MWKLCTFFTDKKIVKTTFYKKLQTLLKHGEISDTQKPNKQHMYYRFNLKQPSTSNLTQKIIIVY